MKQILILLALLSTVSCSNPHSGVYVYESQIYTTTEFSDFTVKHYANYSNKNFFIVLEQDQIEEKENYQKECKKYEIECSFLVFDQKLQNSKETVLEQFKAYKKQKFFLHAPDAKSIAKALGVINLFVHEGNERTLKSIQASLNIEDGQALSKELLKLQ